MWEHWQVAELAALVLSWLKIVGEVFKISKIREYYHKGFSSGLRLMTPSFEIVNNAKDFATMTVLFLL